jgi:hypothetical protein
MRTAHLLEGRGHLRQHLTTVRDLGRLGSALPGPVRVGFCPVAGHDLDPRMRLEPWPQGASLAIV